MLANRVVNRDQSTHWNSLTGRTWSELSDMLDRVLAPLEVVLIAALGPIQNRTLLDVGCGAGATTLRAARLVGPNGRCLGVDISAPLIETARSRALSLDIDTVDFAQADAQIHDFETGGFDAVISRFGVMFFNDPVAAFANLRRAARQGAQLACVAWRSAAENAFMTTAERAAAAILPDFPVRDENAPGQFAFGNRERVRKILEASGWSAIDIRPIDAPCSIPQAELRSYVTRMGPLGAVFDGLDAELQERVGDAVESAFARFVRDGAAHFTSACWLVSARA